MRSRIAIFTAGAALMIASFPLAAAEPTLVEAPQVVPRSDFIEGYNWSARVHATHLTLDATPLHSVLDATSAKPWIDLEITGLQPYQGYEIISANEVRMVHANEKGAGIAWNVPNLPHSWVLSHARSGFIIGAFTVEANPNLAPEDPFTPQPNSCCCAQWQFWNCNRAEPPKPTRTEPILEAWATSHMILPFAEGAKGTLTRASDRAVQVGVVVKGQIAGNGGTAGGELGFKTTTTSAFTTTKPAVYETQVELQKDVYEDDSYKIYAVRATRVESWNPYSHYFDPPDDARIIEINVTGENLEMGYSEEASGALQVGLTAFGERVSVKFEATGSRQSGITMSVPSPPVGSKWAFWFGNGASVQQGLIGAVWQVE